jgi:hypothetical protein
VAIINRIPTEESFSRNFLNADVTVCPPSALPPVNQIDHKGKGFDNMTHTRVQTSFKAIKPEECAQL